MFKMKFNKEELEGMKPVPAGVYQVRFVGFKPKLSKNGLSINLNGIGEVVNNPDHEKRQIWANLNNSIPTFIQDFVHSFGLEMEDQLGSDPSIPGAFDGNPATFNEQNPETWVYVGPLTNKVATWEIGEGSYNGKPKNEIIKFICAVPNCAESFPDVSHSHDMRKKS